MRNLKTVCQALTLLICSCMLLESCQREDLKISDLNENYKVEDHGSYKSHLFHIDGNITNVKEENGQFFFSDCEILTDRQMNFLKKLSNGSLTTSERATVTKNFTQLWPEGKVYYSLSGIASRAMKDTILAAITDLGNRTDGLTFILRTNETNFVKFQDATVNNSSLGMVGGQQIINLNDRNKVNVQHEILHALGIHHEMCRADRDNYINYHAANVIRGQEHNFNIAPSMQGLGEFDFKSIMLYRMNGFTSNGYNTVTGVGGVTWGDNVYDPGSKLSTGDVEGINYLYQFHNMTPKIKYDKNVIFVSGINNSSVINLPASGLKGGTALNLWTMDNSKNQTWRIVSAGNNAEHYIESSIDPNYVWGTTGGSLNSGTSVVIKSKDVTARDQRWKLHKAGDGYVAISPADNQNVAVDISGSSTSNGASVIIYHLNAPLKNNQKFRFLYHN